MKKFIIFMFVMLLIVYSPLNTIAYAVGDEVIDLQELGLEVSVPLGYSVITRDTPANDPVFSNYGITKSEIMSQFNESNIYLNAISDIYNEEIVVTMMNNSLNNFSLLSDTVLNTFASTLVSEYKEYGINVSKYEIYQHSQAKFIKIYFDDNANTVDGLQYYTIYEGKAMNFTMRSYEGYLSSRQEETIKTMVDSIEYDVEPPEQEVGEDTDSFVYTDENSGVVFTVPDNWEQGDFTEDREFINAKFVSTKDQGCTILYGSTDIWEQMSVAERAGYTRKDIDNTFLTKSDIADMYDVDEQDVTTVNYDGLEYYKYEKVFVSDVYSDISVWMTQLIFVDNGWIYVFQFSGTETHKLYSDFENLVASAEYPNALAIAEIDSFDDTGSYNDDVSNVVTIIVFLSVVVIIVLVIVLVYNKKENKTAKSDTDEMSKEVKSTIFCKNCGAALPSDSEFCHICGTKIEEEKNL